MAIGSIISKVKNIGNTAKTAIPNKNVGDFIAANKVNLAFSSGFAYYDYSSAIDEGKSQGEAVQDAAFGFATNIFLGPVMGTVAQMAYSGLPAVASLATDTAAFGRQQLNQSYRPFSWTPPVNSQQYATMRQAGMALAQRSQYSIQTTMMGNEAKSFHK